MAGSVNRRSVSLYWREKLWLLLDGLQLLATLLAALQPTLPYSWNAWARLTSIFLIDVPGLLRPLPATNELGVYPLDALGRAFVLLVVLLLVIAAALSWPQAVYALELYERQQEIEMLQKEQELQRLKRPSRARPSVTAMLSIALASETPTFISRLRTAGKMVLSHIEALSYFLLGKAARLRAALTLLLLPACLAIEVPLIFCSDQADACSSIPLLLIRILCFFLLGGVIIYAVSLLLGDLVETAVTRQRTQQEEYLKQKEIEYLLFINNDWMSNKVWLVSSFKGGLFRSYFRMWLLLLKSALIVTAALLGQVHKKPATGLGWWASLGKGDDDKAAAAAAAAEATNGTLAQAIAAEPLGEAARAATAAALVLLFCLFAITRPPFRCRSSNLLHIIVFLHLGGISGIGLAAAGVDAKRNSFLLYSNQHLLLAVVHCVSCILILFILFCCWLKCLTPTESAVLQQYEAMMGCTRNSSSSSCSKRAADGRGSIKSFFYNIFLMLRKWRRRWCCGSSGWSSSSSSSSSSTLDIGEAEVKDEDYDLQPFEPPWPTRHQHARFWVRVAPHLVEQLAASSRLLQRFAGAEKQLLPVHLANAAYKDLEKLVIKHIGAVDERARLHKRRKSSRTSKVNKEEALDRLLQELTGATTKAAAAPPAAAAAAPQQEKAAATEGQMQLVFKQQRQETDESFLWSEEGEDNNGINNNDNNTTLKNLLNEDFADTPPVPNTLAFKHFEAAAHLSAEFGEVNVEQLQELKSIIKAVEWTVAETFEKMAAIRAAAAAQSIWQESAPLSKETQTLLHDFAVHLQKRKRQFILAQPVRKKILLKLLAIRFLTDTEQQREKRKKEKKKHMQELFGEESSSIFFFAESEF